MAGDETRAGGVREVARWWLPPLAWMSLIFLLSAQRDLPHAPGPWLDTLVKKGAHAAVFGVLAWLFLRGLSRGKATSGRLRWLSFALTIAYGCSDEVHQAFVPGRNPSLTDVLIDSAGAAMALLLYRWWFPRRAARR